MAVTSLSHSRSQAHWVASSLPAGVLLLVLVAPALDLLAHVALASMLPVGLATAAAGLGTLVLALSWLRYPRTTWLLAAVLASAAGVALRLAHIEAAPYLSLLAILALGVGGAFAPSNREALLEPAA